jgi:hypothetical protein
VLAEIRAGAKFETATPHEVQGIVDGAFAAERAKARGFKPDGQVLETFALTDATQTVYIDAVAPAQGFLRNLKLISVQLAASDTCQAFIGTSAADVKRLISNFGTAATSQVTTVSSSQIMLKPGQGIVIKTAAHAPTLVFCTYAEIVAEMAYKSYD